jgi:hypothetical protein
MTGATNVMTKINSRLETLKMKLKDIFKFIKLHFKTIAILTGIIFVMILLAISGGKSKQIQQLLLKLQMAKTNADVATINHQITVNTTTIATLDASSAAATATIASVASANAGAQALIQAHTVTLQQLANAYNNLNN